MSIDDSEVDSGSSRRASASPDGAGPAVKRDSAFEDAGSFADDDDEDDRIADATDVIDQRRVLPWAPCKQTVGGYALNWILGEGAFSTVWKAIGPTNKSVIVKCVEVLPRYQAKGEGRYLSEAEVMRRAHHPRIVQLIDSWVTAESTFLVMEYLPDGDLFNALDEGVVSPEQSMEYMCQVRGSRPSCGTHGCEILCSRPLSSSAHTVPDPPHTLICDRRRKGSNISTPRALCTTILSSRTC